MATCVPLRNFTDFTSCQLGTAKFLERELQTSDGEQWDEVVLKLFELIVFLAKMRVKILFLNKR